MTIYIWKYPLPYEQTKVKIKTMLFYFFISHFRKILKYEEFKIIKDGVEK